MKENQRKSYYIHTQFFNILFRFLVPSSPRRRSLSSSSSCVATLRQPASRASLMISHSSPGRDVDVTVSFLFSILFPFRLCSFYDLRNEKLFFSPSFNSLGFRWRREPTTNRLSLMFSFSTTFLLIDCFVPILRIAPLSLSFLLSLLRSQCYHIACY